MKTAISIPDELYKSAEKLARDLGTSRSNLYVTALEKFVEQYDKDEITRKINEVCAEVDTSLDDVMRQHAKRMMLKSEW